MQTNQYKIVTTSWDDGHILDKKLASLLVKYGLKGTFYISPRNQQFSKKDLLTDYDIVNLNKSFEIGAHTMTHQELTKVSLEEARREIRDSKLYLENLLGKKVSMFCYPKGSFNNSIKKLVKKEGFLGARTIQTYRTKSTLDFFEMGTTSHSVNRNIFFSLALALANNPIFIPLAFARNWVEVSCKIFDFVQKHGGIWHFWSHSWQIDKEGWWKDLGKVFEYVSKRQGVKYFTNSETLAHINLNEENL